MKNKGLVRAMGAVVVAAAVTASLSACGGGDSAAAPAAPATSPSASVPPQVSVSVAALINWASVLPTSDTTEPLNTDAFHPPIDDSAEPTTIH